jgi:PAS domain S-box-containing protein
VPERASESLPTAVQEPRRRTEGASDVVFEQASDAIIVTDGSVIITGWNPAAEQTYGILAKQAIGRHIETVLAARTMDGADVSGLVTNAMSTIDRWRGRLIQRPLLGSRPDDEIIVDAVISALHNPEGRFDGAISFNRDVTATARLEAELTTLGSLAVATERGRSREEIADTALEVLCRAIRADAGLILSLDETYEVIGHRGLSEATIDRIVAEGRIGDRLGEILGSPETAFLAPLEDVPIGDELRVALGAEGLLHLAVAAMRIGGRLVGLLGLGWRGEVLTHPSEAGLLQAATLVASALENARLLLRVERGLSVALASEDRYRTLFERTPDALLVETFDNVVVDANPAATQLFGDGLVGGHVSTLVDINADELDEQARLVDAAGTATWVGRGQRLDGTTFSVEIEATPIQIGGEDRILRRVRDTTDRDQFQQELLQAQKMEAIGLLVAGVAHELNNPLASIVAFSQLIRTDPQLPDALHHQADLLIQEANRTRRIVQNLLDFARQRPPERVPTSIRELIDGVLGLQSYTFGPSRIQVTLDIPDDLPDVSLDRAQIQQVLINLTLNAAQAIKLKGSRGSIHIKTSAAVRPDGAPIVRVSVSDDGPGIPEALRSRLFVPFFTTKPPGEGTGLGLSVSFGIIAGHGGTLRYEPGPGGVGTSFIFELPIEANTVPVESVTALLPSDVAQAAPPTEGVGTSPPDEPLVDRRTGQPDRRPDGEPDRRVEGSSADSIRPWRVMVLDDEPAIRDFLARILRRGGHEPVLAADGLTALELVRTAPPDAILCDHRMAGMSGTAFHVAVAEIDPWLARRFVFMSGDVLNPELSDFAASRGITLLAKPFDIESVDRTVTRILGPIPT